jgi:hypothetical protein
MASRGIKQKSWLIYWVADWYGKRDRYELLFSVVAATEAEAIDAGYAESGKQRTAKLVAKRMPRREHGRIN